MLNVDVESCGFIVNPKWPWLGYSPDGFVNDNAKAIEVKSPFSKKDIPVEEACQDKNLLKENLIFLPVSRGNGLKLPRKRMEG